MKKLEAIAEFFLQIAESQEEEEPITHLKLQKLMYYAQGYHLVAYGGPLFEESLKAWDHGPVVPELYSVYQKHGAKPIPAEGTNLDLELSEEERDFLKEIWELYGQFSAWKLRNMTHSEFPWRETKRNETISHEKLIDYFQDYVSDGQEAA